MASKGLSRAQKSVYALEGTPNVYRPFLPTEETMEIVNEAIERYLEALPPEQDEVLLEMEQLAETRGFPIVGPLVGRLLCLLARAIRAKEVLELGSGYGYSAYWFARGIEPDGRIVCTDLSKENANLAREFFARGKVGRKLQFEVGDALEVIDKLPGPFDIIFMDIDKEQYPPAFPKIIPRLKTGGLLITDNMLWEGNVLEEEPAEASTRGVKEYTKLLYRSPDLYTTIIPIRDGVSVSLKIA